MEHYLSNHDIDSHIFCLMTLIDSYVNQAKFCSRIRRRYFQSVAVAMEENHQSPNGKINRIKLEIEKNMNISHKLQCKISYICT